MKRALLAVALLVLAACGAPAPAKQAGGGPDLSGVTITAGQSNKLSNRTLLQAAGLDNTPYKIKWVDFNATPDMLQAISAGAVDVGGNGGTTGAIQALYAGVGIKVAAAAAGPVPARRARPSSCPRTRRCTRSPICGARRSRSPSGRACSTTPSSR